VLLLLASEVAAGKGDKVKKIRCPLMATSWTYVRMGSGLGKATWFLAFQQSHRKTPSRAGLVMRSTMGGIDLGSFCPRRFTTITQTPSEPPTVHLRFGYKRQKNRPISQAYDTTKSKCVGGVSGGLFALAFS
jgi:hypothetical protein